MRGFFSLCLVRKVLLQDLFSSLNSFFFFFFSELLLFFSFFEVEGGSLIGNGKTKPHCPNFELVLD